MSTRSGDRSNKEEARNKLNKALENAESAEQNQEPDTEDTEGTEGEEDVVPPSKRAKVKSEKEDKKSVDTKSAVQQASYVMKLFDRSVNLAKFEEDTPLYSLCRDWMKNQPRPNDDSNDGPQLQALEEGDIIEMPKVRLRKGQRPFPAKREVKINISEFDKALEAEKWTKEKLLAAHREKWIADKKKQQETLRNFQDKHFGANLALLKTLSIKE